MQLHPVFLLPGHDGQLGGHGLEAVPGALVLRGRLVLLEKGDEGESHVKTKQNLNERIVQRTR